jgi:hypothetical protein
MTGWRKGALAALFAAACAATVAGLDFFARYEFTAHLRDQAAHALALAATAGTPYQWRFRTAEDLVAGHPFGTEDFDFVDGGLRLHEAHQPFEIGLPLQRPLDLRIFPHLQIVLDSDNGGEFRFVVREQLHSGEFVSAPVKFGAGHYEKVSELEKIEWRTDVRDSVEPYPRAAATLRLRFVPAGRSTVIIRLASLQRSADFEPLDLNKAPRIIDAEQPPSAANLDIYRLPYAAQPQKSELDAIVATQAASRPILVLLPQRGRVEQQIALRNAVYSQIPGAILIPEAAYVDSVAEAREITSAGTAPPPLRMQWRGVALLALVLLAARIWPPRNQQLRSLIEILLTLAAPVWLILGGNYDGTLHTPQTVLIGITLIYAISLSMPRAWRWNGDARAWLSAGLVVVLALAIGLLLQGEASHLGAAPGLRQVLRYVGWALLQQYLICAVCTERWRLITGNPHAAVYLGALGFALLHTPNAALMIATFIGGLCWCGLYLRYRALLPLAASHAASALILSTLLPVEILHSAEVSARFFQ